MPCNGAGRYLSIQRLSRPGDSESLYLTLVEVEVRLCAEAAARVLACVCSCIDARCSPPSHPCGIHNVSC